MNTCEIGAQLCEEDDDVLRIHNIYRDTEMPIVIGVDGIFTNNTKWILAEPRIWKKVCG